MKIIIPYIEELVQNIPRIRFLKNIHTKGCWGIGFILGKYVINKNINSITMIATETITLPFVIIKLVVYIVLSLSIKKSFVYPIFDL